MYFAISIGVLAADQDNFRRRDRQGRARPERILHAYSENDPSVFVYIIHFYGVVNLLFSTSEESSKGVYELIIDSACAQVMSLVLHDGHLGPFVLFHLISFDRVETLLAAEPTQYVDIGAAHSDSMCIPALVHRALVRDLISDCQVEAGVLLRRRSTSSYQNIARGQRDCGRTLVELGSRAIAELLDRPLVLINVITKTDLRVDIVAE